MMKFVNQITISDIIEGYYIDPIDIGEPKDFRLLQKMLEIVFPKNERIFILFSQDLQKSGNDKEEVVVELRSKVKDFHNFQDWNIQKEYFFIHDLFSLPATSKILLSLWINFNELRWFIPAQDLGWDQFIRYDAGLLSEDPDGKKMLNFDFSNFIFLKGIGGESLNINYKKNCPLQSLYPLLHSI